LQRFYSIFFPGFGLVKFKKMVERTLGESREATLLRCLSNTPAFTEEIQSLREEDAVACHVFINELWWVACKIYGWEFKSDEEPLVPRKGHFARTPEEIEKIVKDAVKGQDHIIDSVMDVVYRADAKLRDENRPIGVFLFSGNSGVGKTFAGKAFAFSMFDQRKPDFEMIHTPSAFYRIDCAEFTHKADVARLIGSSPGYIGYDNGSPLGKFLSATPEGGVILIDEAEKADEGVRNFFLGLFDRGEFTDNTGAIIPAKNHLFIMTSNIGTKEAGFEIDKNAIGFSICEKESSDLVMRREIKKNVKDILSPELLNRVDGNLIFDTLKEDDLRRILKNEIAIVKNRMKSSGCKMRMSKKAEDCILKMSNTDAYGAREIRRVIEKNILTPISKKISVDGTKNIFWVKSKDDKIDISAGGE
jgi:ATP-dependent Clp protease ATP-binding subunit ClpA